MTNNIQVLFDFINQAAKSEEDARLEREAERLRIEQEEEVTRKDMIEKIKLFFTPLEEHYTHMIDVSRYQTLQQYPYLFIRKYFNTVSIWRSNISHDDDRDIPIQDLLEQWDYDFVSALFKNLESILTDLAIKMGYIDV